MSKRKLTYLLLLLAMVASLLPLPAAASPGTPQAWQQEPATAPDAAGRLFLPAIQTTGSAGLSQAQAPAAPPVTLPTAPAPDET
ncbi:MAG: hypothetical protein KDD77_09565, partial [Caldilineaceae bacterium]|nr:hypothetical protein [Caldilineaceae bacterium]